MPSYIACDWSANQGRRRMQLLLLTFRWAQIMHRSRFAMAGRLSSAIYRFIALNFYAVDLPVQTRVGRGLAIHHGFGLVVNGNSVIGARVVLRHGVTIGGRLSNDDAPTLCDDVSVGPNAVVLGEVRIGAGSLIGAGAVVLADCDPRAVLVGNPARNVRR